MRLLALSLLAITGCASDVESMPPASSDTTGGGGAAQGSGGEGAAAAASNGAGSGATGGGVGGSSGGAGVGGIGVGGADGCPDDVSYDEPCHRDMEGKFCPSSESCSGVLMCLRGKWTLVNPC